MEPSDLAIHILREIRDAVVETNSRVDATNERLDATNERLDATNERLDALSRRITESEMRTATALTELAGAVHSVRDLLRDDLALRDRVSRCEADIRVLKDRAS